MDIKDEKTKDVGSCEAITQAGKQCSHKPSLQVAPTNENCVNYCKQHCSSWIGNAWKEFLEMASKTIIIGDNDQILKVGVPFDHGAFLMTFDKDGKRKIEEEYKKGSKKEPGWCNKIKESKIELWIDYQDDQYDEKDTLYPHVKIWSDEQNKNRFLLEEDWIIETFPSLTEKKKAIIRATLFIDFRLFTTIVAEEKNTTEYVQYYWPELKSDWTLTPVEEKGYFGTHSFLAMKKKGNNSKSTQTYTWNVNELFGLQNGKTDVRVNQKVLESDIAVLKAKEKQGQKIKTNKTKEWNVYTYMKLNNGIEWIKGSTKDLPNIYDIRFDENILSDENECESKYKIGQELGKGGVSVYNGCSTTSQNDCKYAIKPLPVYFDDKLKKEKLEQHINEVRITRIMSEAQLGPKLFDASTCTAEQGKRKWATTKDVDRFVYLVIEKLKGISLGHFLADIKDDQLEVIHKDILLAVHKMHDLGVIHQDLHISNIFILDKTSDNQSFQDRIRFIDFGLSWLSDDPERMKIDIDRITGEFYKIVELRKRETEMKNPKDEETDEENDE